jgi:O-antigen ligase
MKKVFFINDSIENKISYFHLFFFLVALPFDRVYSTIILISFLVHTVIFLKIEKFKNINKITIIPQLVFFVTVFSATYSPSISNSLDTIGKQLAIFLFPLLFTITSLDLAVYRSRIMLGLTISCTLTVIYLYYDAIHSILYYKLPFKEIISLAFVNQNFAEPLDMHPTYLSMLIVLSIVYSMQQILLSKSKNTIYYIASSLVLFAGLIQLGSKSAFIALLTIVIFGFPRFLVKRENRLKFMLTSVLATVLLLTSILSFNAFRNRYVITLKNDLIGTKGIVNMNGRFDRWGIAIDLIKESPVIGTGSGSEIPLLKESYFRQKMYGPYLFSLNAHNQYLSFMINSGISGLLIYLATLSWGFWQSVKSLDLLLLSFIILVAFVSFSEDLLEVNKGIFFYAFFYSFFIRSFSKPVP